jgi:hypothetical protein
LGQVVHGYTASELSEKVCSPPAELFPAANKLNHKYMDKLIESINEAFNKAELYEPDWAAEPEQ